MNMISTGDFLEVNTSEKQGKAVEKLAALWEKKNAKAAQAGGVSLMALSLAACGGSSSTTSSSSGSSSSSTSTDAATNSVGTTGIDTIVGGSGADTLSVSTTTLNAGDSFTGGAGDDLLALFASATGTVGGFVTSGVETISVSNASGGLVTVNMGNVSGETAVRVTGSSDAVTFSSTDTIVPLELSYNSAGNVTVTHNASTVVGTADAMTVKTTDTANGTVTLASIETVTIENSGTSTIDALATTSATTLKVTGSGTLTLTDVDDATTTIDMSGSTGKNTVDGIGAINATITGGSGNDTIKIDSFTKDDTIVGGDGTDTLELEFASNAALTSSAAGDVSVTGIETLYLRADNAGDSIDFDAFSAPASFDLVKVKTDLAATSVDLVDIQTTNVELENTSNATAHDIATLDIDLKDSTGAADAVTLKIANIDVDESFAIHTLRVMGVETLDIDADAKTLTGTAGDTTITNFEATSLKTLNVSGDADLTISATLANTVTTVNAASATGDLNVTMGTSNSTVTGGAGNDTFTYGTTFNDDDTVDGGDGTDVLELTGTNASLNVEATSIETLTVTSTGTNSDTSTLDLDDLTTLVTLGANFVATAGDLTFNNVSATATTVIVDAADADTATNLTVDLDKDTTADAITLRLDMDGIGYNGDITANDFETLTVNFDFASVSTAMSAIDTDGFENLTATDATTIYLASTNLQTRDASLDGFDFGHIDASASVTIDLTGMEIEVGLDDTYMVDALGAATAASVLGTASLATAMAEGEVGINFTAADAVTIVLDDGHSVATNDLMILDLDGAEAINQSAGDGGLGDTNVDTIRFVDDGTATNDIGVVFITNFQDRTNYSATSADKIDLSALGVAGMSELTFTAGSSADGFNATVITSVDGSDSDSVGDDFDGMIILTGVTSTHLTAENFVFSS